MAGSDQLKLAHNTLSFLIQSKSSIQFFSKYVNRDVFTTSLPPAASLVVVVLLVVVLVVLVLAILILVVLLVILVLAVLAVLAVLRIVAVIVLVVIHDSYLLMVNGYRK